MNKYRNESKEIINANIVNVSVEHNGFQGGDAGHGGFVKVCIKNVASTTMLLNGVEVDEFCFEFQGDSERETLIEALEFVVNELKTNK